MNMFIRSLLVIMICALCAAVTYAEGTVPANVTAVADSTVMDSVTVSWSACDTATVRRCPKPGPEPLCSSSLQEYKVSYHSGSFSFQPQSVKPQSPQPGRYSISLAVPYPVGEVTIVVSAVYAHHTFNAAPVKATPHHWDPFARVTHLSAVTLMAARKSDDSVVRLNWDNVSKPGLMSYEAKCEWKGSLISKETVNPGACASSCRADFYQLYGTDYTFTVTAVNAKGERAPQSINYMPEDRTVPNIPRFDHVFPLPSIHHLAVCWRANKDPDFSEFRIWYTDLTGNEGTKFVATGGNRCDVISQIPGCEKDALRWQHNLPVTPGKWYSVWVTAVDKKGNESGHDLPISSSVP